jgi:hypothetical protein
MKPASDLHVQLIALALQHATDDRRLAKGRGSASDLLLSQHYLRRQHTDHDFSSSIDDNTSGCGDKGDCARSDDNTVRTDLVLTMRRDERDGGAVVHRREAAPLDGSSAHGARLSGGDQHERRRDVIHLRRHTSSAKPPRHQTRENAARKATGEEIVEAQVARTEEEGGTTLAHNQQAETSPTDWFGNFSARALIASISPCLDTDASTPRGRRHSQPTHTHTRTRTRTCSPSLPPFLPSVLPPSPPPSFLALALAVPVIRRQHRCVVAPYRILRRVVAPLHHGLIRDGIDDHSAVRTAAIQLRLLRKVCSFCQSTRSGTASAAARAFAMA